MGNSTVWIRRVIRIENTYYVSLPKTLLSELNILRGTHVMVTLDGRRMVLELAQEGYKDVYRRTKCK